MTNKTRYKIKGTWFSTLLIKAQNILRLKVDELSVAVVGPKEMKDINKRFRGRDKLTDVLAFDYGEIVLCPSYIKTKYHVAKKEMQEKVQELFVHGLAHIGGYDHATRKEEEEMKIVEEKILHSA